MQHLPETMLKVHLLPLVKPWRKRWRTQVGGVALDWGRAGFRGRGLREICSKELAGVMMGADESRNLQSASQTLGSVLLAKGRQPGDPGRTDVSVQI